ncbi:MAG: magnesium transporter [Gammaproteobacteria bacterium]
MSETTRQDILLEQLRAENLDQVRSMLGELHPSEIADLLESLPGKERKQLWELVNPEVDGDVLSEMQDAVRAGFLEQMEPQEVAEVTQDLDTDDVADILQDLPEEVADTVLHSMDEQNRERIASLMSYPEDTAGGMMNTDVVSVRADVSLDVVSRYLQQRGELPENTNSLMVVDRENRYLGILSLADLLVNKAERSVGETMTETAAIGADSPSQEVAKLFEQRDLISAAVIDGENKLLGRITVDDVVDVIQEEAEHTVLSMAGLGDDDTFASVLTSGKRRVVWLGINLLTAFFASWVIGRFEGTIQQLVALAILMPIVASMGGIAGNQTLTIAIRALALGQLNKTSSRQLILKEIAVGLLNGGVWAVVVGAVAWLWFGDQGLALIIGLAMMINLLIAAVSGACIPLLLRRLGIDPAIAGGVILTTITDVVGFMTFLGLATLFLFP